MFDFLNELTDWLDEISSNWWFLALIFVIALLDSVVPVVPSETTVIIGGIAAGQGSYSVLFVIVLGALGAFIGDTIAYGIGRSFRPLVLRMLGRGSGDGEEKLAKAAAQIDKRGGLCLLYTSPSPRDATLSRMPSSA